jgi:hypothetical protein
MIVEIQSGQLEPKKKSKDRNVIENLLWTIGQVWNNHSDTAILFDANDMEIDRYSYPQDRVKGIGAYRRKILKRNEDGFEIVNDPLRRAKKVPRKKRDTLAEP